MVVGIVTVRISLPESQSLKDKRRIIKSLKDRARNAMNVSVAEVGYQDKWQISEIAFATVGSAADIVQKRLSEIDKFLRSDPRWVLLDINTETL